MNDQRPKTDQPRPWSAPSATPDPATKADPAKPKVTGGGPARPVEPKAPVTIVAQSRP